MNQDQQSQKPCNENGCHTANDNPYANALPILITLTVFWFCVLGFISLCCLPENSSPPAMQFFLTTFFAVLLFHAIVFQILVSDRQWKVMNIQAEHMRDQWTAMKEGLEKTDAIINQTKEHFSITNRPKIIVTSAKLRNPLNQDRVPIADIVLQNTGGDIAASVQLVYRFGLINEIGIKRFENGQIPPFGVGELRRDNKGIVGNKDLITFATEPLEWDATVHSAVVRESLVFYVWGVVAYADSSDENHYFTYFCLSGNDKTSTNLAYNIFWNRISKDNPTKASDVFDFVDLGERTKSK